MALLRHGAFVEDPWTFPAADAPLPEGEPIAVALDRFLAEREALLSRGTPIGVVLAPGEGTGGIAPSLDRLALVALRFDRFADGRPYSVARQLRDAHRFRGEIRAVGDVLRDQVVLLLRAGFDALEIADPRTVAAIMAGSLVAPTHHYQPAAGYAEERERSGPPWRRRSRSISTRAGGS